MSTEQDQQQCVVSERIADESTERQRKAPCVYLPTIEYEGPAWVHWFMLIFMLLRCVAYARGSSLPDHFFHHTPPSPSSVFPSSRPQLAFVDSHDWNNRRSTVFQSVGCTHSIDRLLQPRNVPRRWSGGFWGFRSCNKLGEWWYHLCHILLFSGYACQQRCWPRALDLFIFLFPGYHALGYHARAHTTYPPSITLPGFHASRLSRHHNSYHSTSVNTSELSRSGTS